MKNRKILAIILAILLIAGIFTVTAGASTPEPTLSIQKNTLELENAVFMNFKVQSKNIQNPEDIQLLVWETAPESYVKGTEDAVLSRKSVEAGTGLHVFQYDNLAAKDMTKVVYVRAYMVIDGKEIYSNQVRFSIAQYAYTALNDPNTTEDLRVLIEDMLAYGASAQRYFKHNTDFLATDPVVRIRAEGGTHADGFKTNYVQQGSIITMMANAPAAGKEFSHWINSQGYVAGRKAALTIVALQSDTYTAVYKDTGSGSTTPDDDQAFGGTSKLPGYENLNFGGDTFIIAGYENSTDGFNSNREVYSDDTDAIAAAVRNRNAFIETLYDCSIEFVSAEAPASLVSAEIASGKQTIDLYTSKYAFSSSATSGMNHNLYSLGMDLTADWWDQAYVDAYTLTNNQNVDTLYSIVGDFSLSSYHMTHALMFNKNLYDAQIAQSLGYDIYQLVRDGKWTMDIFSEMVKKAANDVSGNAVLDYSEGDIVGWATTTQATHGLHTASGLSIIGNTDKAWNFAMPDSTTQWETIINKAIEVWALPEHDITGYVDGLNALSSGNTLFYSDIILKLEENPIRDSGANISVVPYPKYSEAQENYAHYVDNHLMIYMVPKSVVNTEAMGDFFTVYAAHSTALVRPTWIETYANEYCCDGEDSAEMLEIILDTRTYDPGYLVLNEESNISNFISSGKNVVASYISKKEATIENESIPNFINNLTINNLPEVENTYYVLNLDRISTGTKVASTYLYGSASGTDWPVYTNLLDTVSTVTLRSTDQKTTLTISGAEFLKLVRVSLGLTEQPNYMEEEREINIFETVNAGATVSFKLSPKIISSGTISSYKDIKNFKVNENSVVVDTVLQASTIRQNVADAEDYLGYAAAALGTNANYVPVLPASYDVSKATSWKNIVYNPDNEIVSAVLTFKGVDHQYGTDIIAYNADWQPLTVEAAVNTIINTAQGEMYAVFNDLNDDGKYDVIYVKESYPFAYTAEPNIPSNNNTKKNYLTSISNGNVVGQATPKYNALGSVIWNRKVGYSNNMTTMSTTDPYTLTVATTGKLQLVLCAANAHPLPAAAWSQAGPTTLAYYTVVDLAEFYTGIIEEVDTTSLAGHYTLKIKTTEGNMVTIHVPMTLTETVDLDVTVAGATATYTFNCSAWNTFLTEAMQAASTAGLTPDAGETYTTYIAKWMKGRCVEFATKNDNVAFCINNTQKTVITSGFVTNVSKKDDNIYNVTLATTAKTSYNYSTPYFTNHVQYYNESHPITEAEIVEHRYTTSSLPHAIDSSVSIIADDGKTYYKAGNYFYASTPTVSADTYYVILDPTTGRIYKDADGNYTDKNGIAFIDESVTSVYNSVNKVMTVEVRIAASSVFDWENYETYSKIFAGDLIDPNTNTSDKVDAGKDLIYVTPMKDVGYNYVLYNAYPAATSSSSSTRATQFQVNGMPYTANRWFTRTNATTYTNEGSWFDLLEGHVISYSQTTDFTDNSYANGLSYKSALYEATVGYGPYYTRAWDATNQCYTYELCFSSVKKMTGILGTSNAIVDSIQNDSIIYKKDEDGNILYAEVVYHWDDATVLSEISDVLFTDYTNLGLAEGMSIKPYTNATIVEKPSTDEGWYPGAYYLVIDDVYYNVNSNTPIVIITPSANGFDTVIKSVGDLVSSNTTEFFVTEWNAAIGTGNNLSGIAMVGTEMSAPVTYTKDLTFTYNAEGDYYTVSGLATTNTDETIIIPSYYNDGVNGEKPVREIAARAITKATYIRQINIPNTVTTIGGRAFGNCLNLTEITIPASVTSIGNYAFAGCYSLESIYVEQGNEVYESINHCLIDTRTMTLIAGCKNSAIPNGVKTIGAGAFEGAIDLLHITIPESVTQINSGAFLNCQSLKTITLPNSIFCIDQQVFRNCYNLKEIVIPDSITEIKANAFANCENLSAVFFKGNEATWNSIAIDETDNGNAYLTSATVYYYSEERPTEEGSFWHYDVYGNTVIWSEETEDETTDGTTTGATLGVFDRFDFGTDSKAQALGQTSHEYIVSQLVYDTNRIAIVWTKDTIRVYATASYDATAARDAYALQFPDIVSYDFEDELMPGYGSWTGAPLNPNYNVWQGKHQYAKVRILNNTTNNVMSIHWHRAGEGFATTTCAVSMYLQGGAPTSTTEHKLTAEPTTEWAEYYYDMLFLSAAGREIMYAGKTSYMQVVNEATANNRYPMSNWNGGSITALNFHVLGAYGKANINDTRQNIKIGDFVEIDYIVFGSSIEQLQGYTSYLEDIQNG